MQASDQQVEQRDDDVRAESAELRTAMHRGRRPSGIVWE
jgi:hypothetical protein